MSIENVISRRLEGLTRVGKVGMNLQYPNEFELYIIALELCDSLGNTEQYFIFPVNPNSIEESSQSLTNIKKTLGGVSVLSNTTFNPIDIPISGTFGRKLRVLLGDNDYQSLASSFKTNKKTQLNEFDSRVKTGFGCCKLLEEILNSSEQLGGDLKPRVLILHNLAFSSSYVVKKQNIRFTQTQDMNMIWSYTLNLKAVAPLSQFKPNTRKDREGLVAGNYLQSRLSNSINSLTNIL